MSVKDLKVSPDVLTEEVVLAGGDVEQIITGAKRFRSTIAKQSFNADISSTPPEYMANELARCFDKNGAVMGVFHTNVVPTDLGVFENTGEVRCAMDVLNKDGYQAGIRVTVPVEGNSGAYAVAPSIPANAPPNAIVTKSFVDNKLQVVSALPATPDSNVFYFIPE